MHRPRLELLAPPERDGDTHRGRLQAKTVVKSEFSQETKLVPRFQAVVATGLMTKPRSVARRLSAATLR